MFKLVWGGWRKKGGRVIDSQVNHLRFRLGIQTCMEHLSENDIRDFEGGRGNNCFLNLGNSGVDDGGVIENVNGTWEIMGLMKAGHRWGGQHFGNLWARGQGWSARESADWSNS